MRLNTSSLGCYLLIIHGREGCSVVLGECGLSCVDRRGKASRADGSATSIGLIIGLSRGGLRGVQAPLGLQRLLNLFRVAELEVASLLGNGGALMLRLELGDQLRLEAAGLLGVEIADLLRDIEQRNDSLVVTLLRTLLSNTASTADLNRELLTLRVTNKLAGLLLYVPGRAGRLIDSPALFGTLTIADLHQRLVALLHLFLCRLLLEGDLAGLLKILLTHFLLGSFKLRHIGVVALLNILVGALKDGILLECGDGLLLLNAAEAGLGISLAARKVNSSLDSIPLLPALSAGGAADEGTASTKGLNWGKRVGGRCSKVGAGGDKWVVVADNESILAPLAVVVGARVQVSTCVGQCGHEHHKNLKQGIEANLYIRLEFLREVPMTMCEEDPLTPEKSLPSCFSCCCL